MGGWGVGTAEKARLAKLTDILKQLKCDATVLKTKCFFLKKVEGEDKKLSTVASIEFRTEDDRNKFVKMAEEKEFQADGKKLWVGRDKPLSLQNRNKAMKKAAAIIKQWFPNDEEPKIDCKGPIRVVKVGGEVAFTQDETGTDGTWHGKYSNVDGDVNMGF